MEALEAQSEATQKTYPVLKVDKSKANDFRVKLKELGIQGQRAAIRKGDTVYIPLLTVPTHTQLQALHSLSNSNIEVVHFSEEELLHSNFKEAKQKSPFEQIVEKLQKASGCSADTSLASLLPNKWERIGHVLVIKSFPESLAALKTDFCRLLLDTQKNCSIVLEDKSGISGELRTPNLTLIYSKDSSPSAALTETIHIENGVKYKLDVARIMFSSGNGTERMFFKHLQLYSNETVIDMFSGIGYFSIPLAMNNEHVSIVCIEKNPNSYAYLQQNIVLNNVQQRVRAVNADNRSAAVEEYLGTADRVLMGYLPSAESFLHRAFAFLKPHGGIIHYHHLAAKDQFSTLALEHLQTALNTWQHTALQSAILAFRVVKSYSPTLYHCVADFSITFSSHDSHLSKQE